MADASDKSDPRRVNPRYSANVSVDVTYRNWSQVERLLTLNASRGGIFVRSEQSPPVGTPLLIRLALPDEGKLDLRGSIVHIITPEDATVRGIPAGYGIRIDGAHAADLMLLESMAKSFAAEEQAAGADRSSGSVKVEVEIEDPPTTPIADPTPANAEANLMTDPPASKVAVIHVTSDTRPIAIARMTPVSALASKSEVEPEDQPCRSEVVVGIDYGTSYSTIAAVRRGEASIVRDPEGRWLVPSVVSYPETGGVMVGWEARERIPIDPAHTVQSAKRMLGRKVSDPHTANYIAHMAYRCMPSPGEQVVLDLGGSSPISIPQVVSEVLRLLKRRAEQVLNLPVEDAVLVCPVTYEAPQRNALRKAAQLAGLRLVGLLDEPAAAALAYGFRSKRNEIVAVYDFGGGTFDVTLIDISHNEFRIVASAGDPWLGGDDFDLCIATEVANAFWKQHKIELQKRAVEWQRLLFACESAKRVLTSERKAKVEVQNIARTSRGPIDLEWELTRDRFESLSRELVQRSLDVVASALNKAGLEPADIGQVVLTSGVTRIPMVRDAVGKFFERHLDQAIHPEEAVALGAAVQGAALAAQIETRLSKL